MLLVLECLAKFLFHNRPHVDLVPLLQACRLSGSGTRCYRTIWTTLSVWWHTEHGDLFLVRNRAIRMPRTGHVQPIDVELLSDFGHLPWEVIQTMRVEGTLRACGRAGGPNYVLGRAPVVLVPACDWPLHRAPTVGVVRHFL